MTDDVVKLNAHRFGREAANHYVEPAWVSERLFDVEPFTGAVVDPCAGWGTIIRSARAAGIDSYGFDLHDRGGDRVRGGEDFFAEPTIALTYPVDNIVSNPPYGRHPDGGPRLEERFIARALVRARQRVAVFLPATWLISGERGEWLQCLPLYRVHFLSPRPSCPPGSYIEAGNKPGGGRTDYAWLVFLHGFDGTPTVNWLRRDG